MMPRCLVLNPAEYPTTDNLPRGVVEPVVNQEQLLARDEEGSLRKIMHLSNPHSEKHEDRKLLHRQMMPELPTIVARSGYCLLGEFEPPGNLL